MMTEEHKAISEEIRPLRIKKINIKKLRDIYAAYTGIFVRSCFCNSADREDFYNLYYEWYDNYNSDDSSNHGVDEQAAG